MLILASIISAIAALIIAYYTKVNSDLAKTILKTNRELQISSIAAIVYSSRKPGDIFRANDYTIIRNEINNLELFQQ